MGGVIPDICHFMRPTPFPAQKICDTTDFATKLSILKLSWQPTDREYKLFLISQRRFPLYIYTYTNIPTGYRVANSDKSFNFPNT